jgi:hypothetical protein
MEYMIVEAKDDAINLTLIVTGLIAEGWMPLGGVAVSCSSTTGISRFYQAMTRQPDRPAKDATRPGIKSSTAT